MDANVADAARLDAAPPDAQSDARVEAGMLDADSSGDGRVGAACGAATCTPNQRCCDHCQNYCEEATADLACPDDSAPNRACSDASQPVRCGAATCGVGQVCCDHCASRCVSALSGALCPDDTQPNRSCDDGGTAQCAPLLGSCLATQCCSGLVCCSGVPIPEGTAVCYSQACPISDRGQKTGFADIDHQNVLDRVLALPILSWRYKHEPDSITHIGPMAQDFKASFGVGADDKHIFPLDEGGVSLAAIQALHQKLSQLVDAQNKLREENVRLRSELNEVRRELRKR